MAYNSEREKKTLEIMIQLYCKRKEGNKVLCPECQKVLDYACRKVDNCKLKEKKKTCRLCPVHCYEPQMREKIREIMRWSGPRMMFFHPIIAIKHLVSEL